MKITAVEGIACNIPFAARHAVNAPALAGGRLAMLLVRVATDAGLVGWGEAFAYYDVQRAVDQALQDLIAPRCIGQDPLRHGRVIEDLRKQLHPLGSAGPVAYALSGVEIALWDLAGKAQQVPVHQLLGGARAESLRAYASLPRYTRTAEMAQACEVALGQGFRAIKLHQIEIGHIRTAGQAIERTSSGVQLMVDANCRWTLPEAQRACEALSGAGLVWLEEPLYPPDDYAGLALLRESGMPIAAGENAASLADFRTMLQSGSVDYVQPSVAKIGGLRASRRVLELTAETAVLAAPHSPFLGPALAATLHLCAALAPESLVEAYHVDIEVNPFGNALTPSRGAFSVPSGPGLGCDPEPRALAALQA